MKTIARLITGLALCAGCSGDSFVGVDPSVDHGAVFDDLWQQFDLHYSFFELKHVNWDSLGAHYRPLAIAASDDQSFAGMLGSMLANLDDAHVALMPASVGSTVRVTSWSDTTTTFFSAPLVFSRYVAQARYTSGRHLRYGMANTTTGYIYIADFSGTGWDAEMDEALAALPATSIVVDVRNNPGGSYNVAVGMAGRFADRSRTFGYVRRRNGPRHTDFTDYVAEPIVPTGTAHFGGPVFVLANRHSFSSAEDFVLAMRALPNTIVVGDTTGGASGAPIVRELSNGWTYQLSEWIEYTPDYKVFEGTGLVPIIAVKPTVAESVRSVDSILERALAIASLTPTAVTTERAGGP